MIHRARLLVLDADRVVPDGCLRFRGGRIAAAGRWNPRRRPGGPVRDLGDVAILPGLVNVHVHLEWTALRGRIPRTFAMADWIHRLRVAHAGWTRRDFRASLRAGVRRCLETGTTAVGDVVSRHYLLPGLLRGPLRGSAYAEIIHPNPDRAAAGLREARDLLAACGRPRGGMRVGLSPHAPYTVSSDLFRGLVRLARARGVPLAVHAAESVEELEFVRRGTGPLSDLLARYGRRMPFRRPPATTPTAYLARLGLLRRGTLLIHANYLTGDDVDRIARAGAAVAYCPGSHAFFGRHHHPARRLLRAGVPVALGTDSTASNEDLSMPREMGLARAACRLDPREVFRMATVAGARALGLPPGSGTLHPGSPADFIVYELRGERTADEVIESLMHEPERIRETWIEGKRAWRRN